MIVVLGDTHRETDHGLAGELRSRLRAAAVVIHTGDFVRLSVLESFQDEATGTFAAVHGNADAMAVRDRLPRERSVSHDGYRFAVAHGHGHTEASLSYFGREEGADLVLFGHTHQSEVIDGPVKLCNPGSHSPPRDSAPTFAVIKDGHGRILTLDGSVVTEFGLG